MKTFSILLYVCLCCIVKLLGQNVTTYYDSFKAIQARLRNFQSSGLYHLPTGDMEIRLKEGEEKMIVIKFLPNEIIISYGTGGLIFQKATLITFSRTEILSKNTYRKNNYDAGGHKKTSQKRIQKILKETYEELSAFTQDVERYPDIPPPEKKHTTPTDGHG